MQLVLSASWCWGERSIKKDISLKYSDAKILLIMNLIIILTLS